jgi:hypothetical protein
MDVEPAEDQAGLVAAGTPRMRAEPRARAPHQLLDRGFSIDERSLWRGRETVGD